MTKALAKRISGYALLILAIALLLFAVWLGGALWTRSQIQKINAGIADISRAEGVADGRYVTIGGVRQWITVRAMAKGQPLLLYLHGGPGSPVSDFSYAFQKPWEDYFTVVQWDQRGFGRSAIDLDRMTPVTKDQLVSDAIELIELLRRRYRQDKIILVGHSFGTIIGASVARKRPDLLHAYVALGQVTNWPNLFQDSKDAMLDIAHASRDTAFAERLARIPAGPPASDVKAFGEWSGTIQAEAATKGYFWYNARSGEDLARRTLSWPLLSPTISLGQFASTLFRDDSERTHLSLVRSVATWDFRRDLGRRFEVPMIFVSGRHDLTTPVGNVIALEHEIGAPYKAMNILEYSAHVMFLEEPGRVLRILTDEALPFARASRPASMPTEEGPKGDAAKRGVARAELRPPL